MSAPSPFPIWFGGQLVSHDLAHLTVNDRGFLLGEGVFETFVAREGKILGFRQHWERLHESCTILKIRAPRWEEWTKAVASVVQATAHTPLRLRFTVSSGTGPGHETYLITTQAVPPVKASAKVLISPWTRNEKSALAGLKSLSYAANLRCLKNAQEQGADESILLNTQGHLCEGSMTNLFWAKSGVLHTPDLRTGCLPGVTRRLVLTTAEEQGLLIQEVTAPLEHLFEADEAFLTSSVRGIQPISFVNEKPLPAPGRLTQHLAALFSEAAAKLSVDCSAFS